MTKLYPLATLVAALCLTSDLTSAQETAPTPTPAAAAAPAPAAAPSAAQVTPDSTDARAIMKAVEAKPRANQTKARTVLRIIDAGGRTRQRTVRSWAMDVDGEQRQLMIFDEPADVRGTALLSIDYADGARDDDQWLRLPSLKKTTRISSGDRSGSFMGTDLTYADMTRSDPNQWDYSILKQAVKVGDDDCWVIEARPRSKKAKDETGYVKVNLWVSKSKLLTRQVKAWVREGRRIKYIKFSDLEILGGQWTARKIMARTTRGGKVESTTVIQLGDMTADNADVNSSLFDQNSQWWLR